MGAYNSRVESPTERLLKFWVRLSNFCSCFSHFAEPCRERLSKLISRQNLLLNTPLLQKLWCFQLGGWAGLCSHWNLLPLTIVFSGFYVQGIISPQHDHIHVLVENTIKYTLMWREINRKERKEKYILKKTERKILGGERETEKSTAGNRRRMKKKTWEVRGQNEMLRWEMQKSTNAWIQGKKARPRFLIGIRWYRSINPYWFMSPESPIHWFSWSFMDWHHLSIWLRHCGLQSKKGYMIHSMIPF